MEDAGMLENLEGKRGEDEKATNGTALQALYVTSLQTFETCGYFDASYKRRKPSEKKPSKVVALGDGRQIKIIPTQEYGYPNAVDLDYKRALFRIIDEQAERVERTHPDGSKTYHPRIPQPIRAQTKPFIRYAGRIPHPNERKNLNDFLHRGRATTMLGEFEDPKTRRFSRADVALFSQVITRGEKTKDGLDSEYHLIWLTPFAIREYYWHHSRLEDITFHNQLTKPIGKVLCPYLDSGWFASLSKGGKAYAKAYTTLCDFLSIPTYKQPSRIKQQLDPTHEELRALGYLERWEYRQRPNAEWVITWWPGQKWFEDAKARGSDFTPKALPTTQAPPQLAPQAKPSEATELVQHFYTLFHGTPQATPTAKETAQAQDLITTHGRDRARYLVDFAHRTAQETNYQPQTFGGILIYAARAVAEYDATQAYRQARAAVADCPRCDEAGFIFLEDAGGRTYAQKCAHESQQPSEYVGQATPTQATP